MFKRILFATDFSPHAEMAKQVAADLAKGDGGKHLWVLTVLEPVEEPLWSTEEPPGVSAEAWEETQKEEIEALEAEKRARLHADVAALRELGVPVTEMVREGDPAEEIVAAAREVQADVIVMGTHSNRTLWDVILGSVTAHVIRHAPCPVLAVSHTPEQAANGKSGPILVATDFSPAAEKAVQVAASLAKEQQTKLIVVSVVGRGLGMRAAQPALANLAEELRGQGLQVEGLIRKGRRGQIAEAIVQTAQERHARLIVLGSHSQRTIYDLLLGYVPRHVCQHAPCPVLVVSDRLAQE